MKRIEVIGLGNFLAGLKLNKFPKEVRMELFHNFVKCNEVVKAKAEYEQEYSKKAFEGIEQERLAKYDELVTALQNEKEGAKKTELFSALKAGYSDILELIGEKVQAMREYDLEQADTDIKKVDMESFLEGCEKAEVDITPADLMVLEPLFKNEDKPNKE